MIETLALNKCPHGRGACVGDSGLPDAADKAVGGMRLDERRLFVQPVLPCDQSDESRLAVSSTKFSVVGVIGDIVVVIQRPKFLLLYI